MTRETLERKEQELVDEIVLLGSMVEQATVDAVAALNNHDQAEARRIYDDDQAINEKRARIEETTLITIATQQPLATDLRILAAVLEISTELERMGDYAKGIAKINMQLGDEPLMIPLDDITKMAEYATDMLHRALDAFAKQDTEAALVIVADDEKVDTLYKKVYHDLVKAIIRIDNEEAAERANSLLWAAHNLERLADRVTNICERVLFVVTGELIELSDSE